MSEKNDPKVATPEILQVQPTVKNQRIPDGAEKIISYSAGNDGFLFQLRNDIDNVVVKVMEILRKNNLSASLLINYDNDTSKMGIKLQRGKENSSAMPTYNQLVDGMKELAPYVHPSVTDKMLQAGYSAYYVAVRITEVSPKNEKIWGRYGKDVILAIKDGKLRIVTAEYGKLIDVQERQTRATEDRISSTATQNTQVRSAAAIRGTREFNAPVNTPSTTGEMTEELV